MRGGAMSRVYPARTVLAQRIRERRLTLEEFSEQLEIFARENNEVGTVSIRHVQRLAAGQFPSDRLRPATARLLERYFESPIEELLASPETKNFPTPRPGRASLMSRPQDDRHWDLVASGPAGSSEDMIRRELLRLLSMVAVLVTMPGADEQLDQLDYPSITLRRFDNVTADDCKELNEHLWSVFMLSKSKGPVLPLVRDQLEMLTVGLSRSRELSTHRQLCALTSELLQLAGEIFFDANKYSDAAYCYTLAAAASKEANSFDLWACAMTRHAFIEMYERHFDKAAPMLELAACLARRGDRALSTRYWVSSVQAQAFAGLGELVACERALDAAEQVRELSGDLSNGGWLRFDGSRLAEERGTCYVQLGRPDLAENILNDALRQNLSARRRASVLTDLATIGIQRGDLDQLITYTEPVLEIATRTGSGFIGRKLQGLQNNLAPLLEDRRVRQLNEQIMSICRNT
jgi:tetratricopeptide (TPR) repeat protein